MLACLLLTSLPGVTQPPDPPQVPQSIDLPAALDRVRRTHPVLQAARARIEERQGALLATRADALPQLTLSGDFTRSRTGDLTNSGTPASLISPSTVSSTQLTLTQPLFQWGKVSQAIQVARLGEQEARHALTSAELDALHGVARAYLDVLTAQAELDVLRARRDVALRFLCDIKAKRALQTVPELDRLRAESEYLALLPETLQAEARGKRAQETLNRHLGLDPKARVDLRDPGAPDLALIPTGGTSSEVAQMEEQERIYRTNERILRSELRPKLDLTAACGYQAEGTARPLQDRYDTWRVNVTLRFPLFDGLRSSGKRAQNRAQLEQVSQLKLDKERAIAVERSSTERELATAQAFREAAEAAHTAALEALRTSREAFDLGLITSLDLLQAERAERLQESQRQTARFGVWNAWFALRRAHGLPPL